MDLSVITRSTAAAALLMACCACSPASTPTASGPKPLAPVEVRQYQGKQLSSVNDFIENSIKGPQKVDRVKYRLTVAGDVTSQADLLDRAGVRPGATTVIFHGVDGYTTSLPLSYLRSNDILMAYRMNGIEIPAERGFPFMLVAQDKWGYKWCKWIDRIEVSTDAGYRGYWEQRGYTLSGDRAKPSIGP
jgi:hypothetical protein